MFATIDMPMATPSLVRPIESTLTRRRNTADVFAKRERDTRSTERTSSRREIAVVELPVGRRVVRFTYSGQQQLPAWYRPAFESLAKRWGVERGWDGHGGAPTEPTLVVELLNGLDEVMPDGAPAPLMTPIGDGGMQAEWHKGGKTLEIVAMQDEPLSFYFCDRDTGRDQVGEVEAAQSMIREILRTW